MRAPISFLRLVAVPALLVLFASPALAGHIRPKGAKKYISSLVPAYQACSAPDRVHGPPLSFGSCSPAPTSQYVTVGTPDVNGAAAQFVGSVEWKAYLGLPGPPHDTQSFLRLNLTDIRCTAAATTCGSANAAGGADYTGELAGEFTMRITDHHSAVSPGGGTDPATLTDYTYRYWFWFSPCSATADPSIGSTCTLSTNANNFVNGFTPEGARTIWELSQARIYDGGADGVGSSAGDNTLFAVQGLFVP